MQTVADRGRRCAPATRSSGIAADSTGPFGEGVDVASTKFARCTDKASTSILTIGAIPCEIGAMFANASRWPPASHGHNARLRPCPARLHRSTDALLWRLLRSVRRTCTAASRNRANCASDGCLRLRETLPRSIRNTRFAPLPAQPSSAYKLRMSSC
jgi:hypothetical protein